MHFDISGQTGNAHLTPSRALHGAKMAYARQASAVTALSTQPIPLQSKPDPSEGELMRKTFSIRFLLAAVGMLIFSAASLAQWGVGVVVSFGPPELPVYEQPICP